MPGLASAGAGPPLTAAMVWAYVTRLLTSLETSPLIDMEHEIEFPSADDLKDISATGDQYTDELTITVALPTGASIRRVLLVALITAMNNTASAQKIKITVQGRKGAGSWNNYFDAEGADCIGFGAVDGVTTSLVAVQDVSALVDEAASYGFRVKVNQSAAQSVHYTSQFVLVLTYRMS